MSTHTKNTAVGLVQTRYFTFGTNQDPFPLVCGKTLAPITIAYETYGKESNKERTILILHALSGDAHAAGRHQADDPKPGWWDRMIGPGRTFDTDRYYIVCSNVLGGCMGSTGPSSVDPKTGKPYGSSFPLLTIKDMVACQARLVRHLGIERLFCVVGGSMGGMQALQWALDYPDMVLSAIPIATAARHSPQCIAFYEVGRQAIITDPNWQGGDYYNGSPPDVGLALARMIAHITYLSEEAMHQKFSRRLQDSIHDYSFSFDKEFQVESYLHHQGSRFVERFDANSYLIISKAMDYFDISHEAGSLSHAFSRVRAKFLVVSFSSDWHYPPSEAKKIVTALRKNDVDVTYSDISSSCGHDAFLIEHDKLGYLISGFLGNLVDTRS